MQRWQKTLDEKKVIGTVLLDLSKAYDCINHNLLLAKLEAYGFTERSLLLMKLKGRKHRTKLFNRFSRWLEINLSIPQDSILGPLLFNIFLNDIFFIFQENDDIEICNFADDNTIFTNDINIENVIIKLQKGVITINNWIKQNSLVANPSKFQLMFLGIKDFLY